MKLVWLRRDLRGVDNLALQAAIDSGDSVMALFVATPQQWQQHDLAPIQADFIFRRLTALRHELSELNVPLLYHQVDTFSQCVEFILDFSQRHNIDEIFLNKEYEFNEAGRDQYLIDLATRADIVVRDFDDKCILRPGEILNRQGDYFKVFTPFKKAWLNRFANLTIAPAKPARSSTLSAALAELQFDQNTAVFSYPRLSSAEWPAPFEQARSRLRQFCRNEVKNYHLLRDFPAREQTSRLSPYLAIGVLSARQCIARLYAESESGILSEGAQSWLNELIWREFYQHLIYFCSGLSKGDNFHAWADNLSWRNNPQWFERWKKGETGYPIVDAAMRQLNNTGWMHNRLRMIVASFLTKDLHINWRLGEAYFMSKLIDGDYAANNGGWQWCASTGCDGQPYFRIFNPVSQGEKFDPNGEFVRFWIPELKNVPDQYIHAPWKWTSVSSLSYPAPIVDHKEQRTITLSIYKKAKDNETDAT